VVRCCLCRRGALALIGVLCLIFSYGMVLAQPDLMSRNDWKAKPARADLLRRQVPREIIIHHTSVRQQPGVSLERKMRGLQSFSQRTGKVGSRIKPAWGDVPYHFYIGVSGRIAEGLNVNFAGNTNTRYDTRNRLQIVLEGNFEIEKPNARQLASLHRLVVWLVKKHKIPVHKITAHNDHAATSCPGKYLRAHFKDLREIAAASQ